MCASSWARGVPDVSKCLARDRLAGVLHRGESGVCALVAPSGYGKSVAAAQFALQSQYSLWIDASSLSVHDGRGVAQETLRALQMMLSKGRPHAAIGLETMQMADLLDAIELTTATLPDESVCVVLDNVSSDCIGAAVAAARQMGSSMRRRARFVLTTRRIDGDDDAVVRNCTILGVNELRLTEQEAAELLSMHGSDRDTSGAASALRAECGGHVAIFSVLARNPGIEMDYTTTSVSLELWLEHLVGSHLNGAEQSLAAAMALLKTGTRADLRGMGIEFGEDDLRRVSTVLPLVALSELRTGRTEFTVHDSVVEFWMRHPKLWLAAAGPEMIQRAVPVLTSRGDIGRAAMLLSRIGEAELCADWLLEHGSSLLEDSQSDLLFALLDLLPLSTLFAQPGLLLLSAAVAAQAEDYEDALARAKAALSLADHGGDLDTKIEAISRSVHCLCNLGQFDRASELSAELMRQPLDDVATETCASALLALGIQAAARGEFTESEAAHTRVKSLVGNDGRDSRTGMLACLFSAVLPGLAEGDFARSALQLAPLIDCRHLWLTDRLGARGNLAVCLCEMGRLERARLVLREVLEQAEDGALRTISGCFLPTLGSVEAALGRVEEGVEMLKQGIQRSLEAGDEQSAQVNRIYLSTVLRAAGAAEESLMHAERAFEHLSVVDVFRCRRLAALEVGADFLALGDTSTAAAWVRLATDEGFEANEYHELRADMILAEIDRREGMADRATARIAKHTDYILSGSPNWQVAMYCRAFPELLLLIANAVNTERLPEHLLRMIPSAHIELAVDSAIARLDESASNAVGRRLLDDEALERRRHGGGVPTCHVRVFGGLEVSVGSRTIRDREWRKRKARALFAMMVVRRGQDIPRDQILEHLWPVMDEDRAKNNLYVAWSTMKSVLGGEGSAGSKSPYVENAHGVCRVVATHVRSDIDEFEDAIHRARQAETAHDFDAAIQAYEQVALTYRGEMLPGDIYDDWYSDIRSRYHMLYVGAMQSAALLLLSGGDGLGALAFARRAMQADGLREDLFQLQMRCQIQACQRSSAVDTYLLCRQRLADELGLDPSAETRAMYDEILAMEVAPPPFQP